MTLSMEEVERRLRCGGWTFTTQELGDMADAIREHMKRCVDVEKVLEVLDREVSGEFGYVRGWTDCSNLIRALLPPQKSALQRAIEMVESHRPRDVYDESLLALLREAEKEAK